MSFLGSSVGADNFLVGVWIYFDRPVDPETTRAPWLRESGYLAISPFVIYWSAPKHPLVSAAPATQAGSETLALKFESAKVP